jgi:hypothetical protein
MGQKLKAVGCGIAPQTDRRAANFQFTAEEVEVMARIQHKRLCAERVAAERELGERDAQKKTNPNLLPWEQAPAEAKELTRRMVRRIPVLLARVDLQVCRLGRTE